MNPYAIASSSYHGAGFSPIPVPLGKKSPPPSGWTGTEGKWVDREQVAEWSAGAPGNVALRLPDGVIGIDVDAYDGKRGGETLEKLEEELGELPVTWVSTSRQDGVSGIRLYRVPSGREWRDVGDGVEVVRYGHRYMVCAPSVVDERTYGWKWGAEGARKDVLPLESVEELPWLPNGWVERLTKRAVSEEGSESRGEGERPAYAVRVVERELERLDDLDMLGWSGPGWDNTCFEVACNLVELGNSGWSGYGVEELEELFLERCPVDEEFGTGEHMRKWGSALKTVGGEGRPAPAGLGIGTAGDFDPVGSGSDIEEEAEHYDPWDVSGDANLGQRLAHDYMAGRFLAWGKGRWAKWDGKRWDLEVPEDEVVGFARNALLDVLVFELGRADRRRDAAIREAGNDKQTIDLAMETHKERTKSLKRLRSLGTILGALRLARGLLVVRLEDFDGDRGRWLLNCGNGVVDLRDGSLRSHDRDLLFTRVTDVDYVPGAESEDWNKALLAIPDDIRDWLQMRIGQAATGFMPPDDLVPFWRGGGENGKSTLLTGIKRALGPFYVAVPDKVLTGGASDHSTEFMTLKGARMAVIEELPGGDWLEDTRLKKVVGSDSGMTARWIGQNNVTWDPTHSLVVTTNHQVRISDMSWGTWRRLARVNFPYVFDGETVGDDGVIRERDGGLRGRLAASGGSESGEEGESAVAVLAWIVEGAVRMYAAGGLTRDMIPERVLEDTRYWRLGGDPIPVFFREMFEAGEEGERVAVETRLIYELYRDWAGSRGYRAVSDQQLWARFEQVKEDVGLGVAEKRRLRRGDWSIEGRSGADFIRILCGVRLSEEGREIAF